MSARGQPLSRARLITSGKIHSGRFTDRTKALNCPRVSQTSSVKYGPAQIQARTTRAPTGILRCQEGVSETIARRATETTPRALLHPQGE